MNPEKTPEAPYSSIEPVAQKYSSGGKDLNKARSMIFGFVEGMQTIEDKIEFLTFMWGRDGETPEDLTRVALDYFVQKTKKLEQEIKEAKEGNGARDKVSATLQGLTSEQKQ